MPEQAFLDAALPIFESGAVDVLEWSVDLGWGQDGLSEWLTILLDEFAEAGRLDAHGVTFSLLSLHPRQDQWIEALARDMDRRQYRRVSEHLGFMAAGPIFRSTPLPMPHLQQVTELAVEQLGRLEEVVGQPLGLENLATSLGMEDAVSQPALVREILTASNGWLLLDLHNLWCQAVNHGLDASELLAAYPLELARELHVSGGSWWTPPGNVGGGVQAVRRDTHDGRLPPEVLGLLAEALALCPQVDTVILEQLGGSLAAPGAAEGFREDFAAIRRVVGEVQ